MTFAPFLISWPRLHSLNNIACPPASRTLVTSALAPNLSARNPSRQCSSALNCPPAVTRCLLLHCPHPSAFFLPAQLPSLHPQFPLGRLPALSSSPSVLTLSINVAYSIQSLAPPIDSLASAPPHAAGPRAPPLFRCIWNLSRDRDIAATAVREGAVPALVDVVAMSCKTELGTAAAAAGAISNLSVELSCREAVAQRGGVELLVQLLRVFSLPVLPLPLPPPSLFLLPPHSILPSPRPFLSFIRLVLVTPRWVPLLAFLCPTSLIPCSCPRRLKVTPGRFVSTRRQCLSARQELPPSRLVPYATFAPTALTPRQLQLQVRQQRLSA